jgi:putative membrane protein
MKAWTGLALAVAIAAPAVAQPMRAGDYVKQAGAGDLYERQSSQLVLATTRNPEVRRFAQMMVRDHTKSTADVKRAAAQSRVRVMPPRLTPAQARMIAQLRAAPARVRDVRYIEQQRDAHAQALALHQGYARGGDAPALRRVASTTAPVVQHHIDMLQRMRP